MNTHSFTPSTTFNIGGTLHIATSARIESLLLTGEVHEIDRIQNMVKAGALKPLNK